MIKIVESVVVRDKSNRKAMNRNWSNQKANPALKPPPPPKKKKKKKRKKEVVQRHHDLKNA